MVIMRGYDGVRGFGKDVSGRVSWSRWMGVLVVLCGLLPGWAMAEPPKGVEILLNTADGKPLRLADFRGKVVVINFWATWCPPCIREIPGFVRFQEAYADKGVVVVGINFMDQMDQKTLVAFKKKKKINYPLVYGTPEQLGGLARDLGGVFGLPTSKILNRQGQVVASHAGGLTEKALRAWVDPLLVPKAPSTTSARTGGASP